jgi:catechol 2,3-dioxygenase-like lactoylglutathione lyase family enzyme
MSDHTRSKSRDGVSMLSRRALLGGMGLAALAPLVPGASRAQATVDSSSAPPTVSQLPLKTTGLEHMGTIVPDVTAAAKFYGRLFNPELYKEKDLPLRYYVTLGVGYLALGTHADQSHAYFDHFCALVQDYDAPAMAQQLKAEGLPAGRYGIIPDPDGVGFQLLGAPGGLAKTTEPAGRLIEAAALVRPVRLDHVVLHVSDLEKSLQFYRRFLGKEEPLTRDARQEWFRVAGTRLVLETASSDESARIDRICIKVQPFDRKAVSRELTQLGARVAADPTQGLRFTDPFGLVMELQSVANT